MLRNSKISTRLLLLLAVQVFILTAIAVVNLVGLRSTDNEMQRLSQRLQSTRCAYRSVEPTRCATDLLGVGRRPLPRFALDLGPDGQEKLTPGAAELRPELAERTSPNSNAADRRVRPGPARLQPDQCPVRLSTSSCDWPRVATGPTSICSSPTTSTTSYRAVLRHPPGAAPCASRWWPGANLVSAQDTSKLFVFSGLLISVDRYRHRRPARRIVVYRSISKPIGQMMDALGQVSGR